MTSVSLGQEYGLNKRAKLVNIEINDEQQFIRVFYREEHYTTDSPEVVVKTSEIKSYTLTGQDYTDWDAQIGVPVIRPAIVSRLSDIYGI